MKKLKTYAEENNQAPFDWRKFLKQPEISDAEWEEAERRSQSWVTCACGNQCSIIPRENDGAPKNKLLRILGGEGSNTDTQGFHAFIKRRDAKAALHTLNLIEMHSAFLIEQEKEILINKLNSLGYAL